MSAKNHEESYSVIRGRSNSSMSQRLTQRSPPRTNGRQCKLNIVNYCTMTHIIKTREQVRQCAYALMK